VLPFRKQYQIPRLKSASEVYKFRLSKNGKLNRRLAEVFAAADRILQILAVFPAAAIFQADFRRRTKFGRSGYSAAAQKSSSNLGLAVCQYMQVN